MKCPQCGSEDTMTKKMAYHTHTTTGTSEGSSTGLSVGGSPTISAGTNRGKSRTTTGIAELAAPPETPPEWSSVMLGYLAIVGIAALLLFGLGLPGWAVGPILFVGAGFLAYVAVQGHGLQMDNYYEQCRRWEETWICLRDGYQWMNNPAQ